MAFAIACGLSPTQGLITAIVAGFLISLFSGSKYQIGGPTGAFVIIIMGVLEQYHASGLLVCTLMAGLFLIIFGFCRMGRSSALFHSLSPQGSPPASPW